MKYWLLDTGPLVAYLDSSDPAHETVTPTIDKFSGILVTTGAVITEAMHFVSSNVEGPRLLVELVTRSGLQVYDLCQPPELRRATRLMERYFDTPMDFADATLVLLGEALNVFDVATLDRRGFSTYRAKRNKPFRLMLVN